MAKAICVDPKEINRIWFQVSHWIKLAMERGDLGRFESVEADVLNGHALLWLSWNGQSIEAACVTKLDVTESTKACVIVACGGAGRWSSLITDIERYAQAEGCGAVRIYGRPGWARVLPGYRVAKIVLERRM